MSCRIVKSFADRQARRMESLGCGAPPESGVGLEGDTGLHGEAAPEEEAVLEGGEAGLMQYVHKRRSRAVHSFLV